jgi:hypothetical protein
MEDEASFHKKQAMLSFVRAIQAVAEADKADHLAELELHRSALRELHDREQHGTQHAGLWL